MNESLLNRARLNALFGFLFPAFLAACSPGAGLAQVLSAGNGVEWYRGNTHTHTLWSDGDAAPELSVAWYKDHGYDFLALSDHNVLSDTERWFPVDDPKEKRLNSERLAELRSRFGADWVETREEDGRLRMRLKTLPELRERFEEAGKFLLIQAEEVTDQHAVHINAVNLREVIPPAKRATPLETLKANFENIEAQSKRLKIPILAHLNHPNFAEGVTPEDMISLGGERFFEVYNGHPAVYNDGGAKGNLNPSTDRLWDIILSMRMREGGSAKALYGLATDDTHNYFSFGTKSANAGRGWVMVLAEALDADKLITAMKRGAFYSTSGVTLDRVAMNGRTYEVKIAAEPGVTYTTSFIGTLKDFDATSEPQTDDDGKPVRGAARVYSEEIGRVLMETDANPAVYTFTGDELYVRARINSSKPHPNPYQEGDMERAWTQPAEPRRSAAPRPAAGGNNNVSNNVRQ